MRTVAIGRFAFLVALLAAACQPPAPAILSSAASPDTLPEQPVQLIPLAGVLAGPEAEISGLAWYGDHLILLPQNPGRLLASAGLALPPCDGVLFALSRRQILAALDGSSEAPLRPTPIPFFAPKLDTRIPSFEGYEAIAFFEDRVFMTIESAPQHAMRGSLLSGTMAPDLSALRLDTSRTAVLPPQAEIGNMAYEALVAWQDTLMVLYEANGANVNRRPRAYLFDHALRPLGTRAFPVIEYRITDATTLDEARRFWAANYFFPGERRKLRPAADMLAARFGTGATHRRNEAVERLVEFQLTRRGIVRTEVPPLLLRLLDDAPRNWEGLARLDERGFLLVTDEFPRTMLAFVPAAPDAARLSR